MVLTKAQKDNFWAKVDKTEGCWNWNACLNKNGYGKFNVNGDNYSSHRISLLLTGHDIVLRKKEKGAAGIIVMHICDNRKCVNPAHLRITTQKENMSDAKLKGRKWNGELSGENNPNASISVATAQYIKYSSIKSVEIMKLLNVSRDIVYSIRRNKSWLAA